MRYAIYSLVLALSTASLVTAGDVVLCLEAESGTAMTAPLRVIKADEDAQHGDMRPVADGASGAAYLEVAQGKGNPPKVSGGTVSYSVALPESGTYTLWCRVWWLDECGNSFGVEVNGERAFTFGQDATYKKWHWVKSPPRLRQLQLKAGTHTLKLLNREDGIRIDQILLSNDRRFVPVDIERVTP